MAGNSRKAVIAALLANGGIAVAKFAGFAITRSASMLAEGVHSVADTGNQGLLANSFCREFADGIQSAQLLPDTRNYLVEWHSDRSGTTHVSGNSQ
jgi:hypothetical protein